MIYIYIKLKTYYKYLIVCIFLLFNGILTNIIIIHCNNTTTVSRTATIDSLHFRLQYYKLLRIGFFLFIIITIKT